MVIAKIASILMRRSRGQGQGQGEGHIRVGQGEGLIWEGIKEEERTINTTTSNTHTSKVKPHKPHTYTKNNRPKRPILAIRRIIAMHINYDNRPEAGRGIYTLTIPLYTLIYPYIPLYTLIYPFIHPLSFTPSPLHSYSLA